ncbi:hypothetical protein [Hymenobacter psychrophilus]|uniref:Uncharacterized protein n=1 Tax=Hymenobacter psychrophilus TaxID=651662 RepID=A0A1H3I5X1_9BACT|nr:hypothetical protein [Hymenobacter psychrophilus]SDY22508.1 hypothetical protein SAMN04488069_106282 [Hymenobacter psychrophilus]
MSKQLVFSALALAALALGGCSAEPSDWRPDKKVSVDMVAPGTRESENYGHTELTDNEKGGAIAEPISSGVTLDEPNQRKRTTAEEARSANDPSAPLTRSPEALKSVKKPSDTTATKALDGPMQ